MAIHKIILRDRHGRVIASDSFASMESVVVNVEGDVGTPSATATYENGVLGILFRNIRGVRGNGITSIEPVSVSTEDEGVNTYRITDNDGNTYDFEVHNGHRGNGIASIKQIEESQADGGTNTWRITDTDGNHFDISLANGSKGSTGDKGNPFTYADFTPAQLEALKVKGDKGDKGDSAVYDPEDPSAPDFVMANTTGQSTTKAMTQKAVTDSINAVAGNIPVYGKQNPIIGLSGATEQWLTIFNKIIKSFSIKNIAEGKDKENVRFVQLYCNVTNSFWQFQLGYYNGSSIVDLEAIIINNRNASTFQSASFIAVVDWDELDAIQPSQTTEMYRSVAASNPYKVHFTDDDVYFDGNAIEDGSIGVNKINENHFDSIPTAGSNKIMRSKDIKNAIDAVSLDNFGKKASIVGRTGYNATKLQQANSIIKSIKKLTAYPQNYTEARLKQIYAINAGVYSWQIQIGYVVAGQTALQDIESFGVNTLGKTKYQSSQHYTEIEVDWEALNSIGGTSTALVIIDQLNVNTNYYGIHFVDDDRYISTDIIRNGSIDESKLSSEVQDKLNTTANILKGKHLVTLCDSLGATGAWQTKLAELTGMVFNSTRNNGRYSVGGTKTLTPYMNCGQGRALQLISDVENNLIDAPDVIIIENVNDGGWEPGTLTDESFILTNVNVLDNTHKQTSRANAITYWNENKATILSSLTPRTGTIIGVPYSTNTGIKLTITHDATASGSFGVLLSGETTKYITVASGDSIETIVDKIMEYNFSVYVYEKYGTDSIIFTRADGSAGDIAVYPGSTGITSTITRSVEGTQAYYVYFKGHDTANWNTAANWVTDIPLYQAWKGMVEMLVNAFPNAVVYWFIPKAYQFNYNDAQYTRADGTPNWDAMLANDYQTYLLENQIKMAKYMNIPVLDIRQDACITAGNISVYFNASNVHPKNAGYNRWGATLARLLL